MTTPAALLTAVGRALFGEHFKAPLAKALSVSVDRIDDWSKGRGNGPAPGVWLDIAGLIQDRERDLPLIKVSVLELAGRPAGRVYKIEGSNTTFIVKPDEAGTYPKVQFSRDAFGGPQWWGDLPDDARQLPADTQCYRLERDGVIGNPTQWPEFGHVYYPEPRRTTVATGTFTVDTNVPRRR